VNFAEAESYLYSLGNEVAAMKLGLANITTLLSALGDPHAKYKKVQVAGTNGKGSVCAMLDSICGKAGMRRGLYTSPHLISITERIRIDGVDISEAELARRATQVRSIVEELVAEGKLDYTATYFEQVTAIALLAFAEAGVELAILETGLGGRFDAVTAAEAEIVGITNISPDHQEYLGDSIEEIAAEKAAIIGENVVSVVIGRQSPRALDVILKQSDQAFRRGAHVREAAVVFDDSSLGMPLRKLPIHTGLRGDHQFHNAEVAVLLADELKAFFPITNDQIRDGLKTAVHPGRLEYIGDVLFDGAHNPAGAAALSAFLEFDERRPITLIFGSMRDKNVAEMAAAVWPRAKRLILTKPSNSRAMSAEELAEHAPVSVEPHRITKTGSVADALKLAREITPEGDLILVTGSLYLVGEARKLLNN
jgi:dihydrofolate synthase/folylpolyglutamate synthase